MSCVSLLFLDHQAPASFLYLLSSLAACQLHFHFVRFRLSAAIQQSRSIVFSSILCSFFFHYQFVCELQFHILPFRQPSVPAHPAVSRLLPLRLPSRRVLLDGRETNEEEGQIAGHPPCDDIVAVHVVWLFELDLRRSQ